MFLAILALIVVTGTPFTSSPMISKLSHNPLDHSALLPESTQTGDFIITGSPPPPTDVNQSVTTTIGIATIGVFTQEISLMATSSDGLSCEPIGPPKVTGNSTATTSCFSSIANNYTLTVTGRSGSLFHSTTVVFHFMDFAIYATSPKGNANSPVSSLISVRGVNGFSSPVTLSATSQSDLNCGMIAPAFVIGSGTADISCQAASLGTYLLTISGTSDHLIHSINASFFITKVPDFSIIATTPKTNDVGQEASSIIAVQGVNAFSNQVTFTDSPPSDLSCQEIIPGAIPGPETAIVSCTSDVAGTYVLNITGTSGSLSHSTNARFNFVDFELSASSPSPSNIGSPVLLEITVTPLNGLLRPVTLTDSPAFGLHCTAITQPVLLSGTALISCQASVAGPYAINVTGTSNSLSHSRTVTLNFQDFQLTASSPETVGIGTDAVSAIRLTPQNGFSGSVNVSDTVPVGLNCKPINPSALTAMFSATVSCESDLSGSFNLTIDGNSGSIAHRIIATFTFATPDFRITTGTSSLNTNMGSSTAAIVEVTELHGFSSSIALSVSSPLGLSCDLNPATIDPHTTSALTCKANKTGDFVVIVTGTAGGRTQNATLYIHVSALSQASPIPATLLGLGIFIWYGIIGTTVAIMIGAVSFIVKKSKRPRPNSLSGITSNSP